MLCPPRAHTPTQNGAQHTHRHGLTASFFLSLLEIPKVTRCENAMWRKPRKEKEWSDESWRAKSEPGAGGFSEEEGIRV